MSYQESFEDSIFSHDGPMTLMERLGYVKQLVFSRTKLEFRVLWNKIFQREDEELGWLLNPYRQGQNHEATMLASFNKNVEESYQFGYDHVGSALGREKVTVYSRGVARKGDTRRKRQKEKKSLGESALEIARYMGMGVYMTSTSFPSPFLPINDHNIIKYEDNYFNSPVRNDLYTMSKLW